MTRLCNTPGCGRATPSSEHGYCRDCIGTVLRTGRPPQLAVMSPWVKRALANQLPAKTAA